jgi:small multidrug resistance pump
MCWIYVLAAILLDVAGTVCLKLAAGAHRALFAALTLGFYGATLVPFGLAARDMQIGLLYAVWSSLATVAIALIGMLWFKEPANAMKLFSIALIIAGLVVLNLSSRVS